MPWKVWIFIFTFTCWVPELLCTDFKGHTTLCTADAVIESAAFLRAKDWGQTLKERSSPSKEGTFDYSIAKHEVQIKLETNGCKDKDGWAQVSITFTNIMHRDEAGRSVTHWGLMDPDHYLETKAFVLFKESDLPRHQQEAKAFRSRYKITNPSNVSGRTFSATLGGMKIPCDGKTHQGRVWVGTDPHDTLPRSSAVMNTYEVAWEAQSNDNPEESRASFRMNVSPGFIKMKKYLLPNSDEFMQIPIKPKVPIGEAHDPNNDENVVTVPELSSLESYGIFIKQIAEVLPGASQKAQPPPILSAD